MRALSFATARPSASASTVFMPGFALPSASAFASAMSVPGSFALLLSALPSAVGMSLPVLRLSAPLSTTGVPMPRLSTPPSKLSMSGVSVPLPGLLAHPFVSGVLVPGSGSSPPPFFIWSSPQILTPIPG